MSKKSKAKKRLPKRIAGVKLPKSVRKGALGGLLASKTGRLLIAEAIMAAGAVGAAKKAGESPKVRHLVSDTAHRLKHADRSAEAGGVLAYALGEAVRSFADALRRGEDTLPRPYEPARPADLGQGEADGRKDAPENPTLGPSPL